MPLKGSLVIIHNLSSPYMGKVLRCLGVGFRMFGLRAHDSAFRTH